MDIQAYKTTMMTSRYKISERIVVLRSSSSAEIARAQGIKINQAIKKIRRVKAFLFELKLSHLFFLERSECGFFQ